MTYKHPQAAFLQSAYDEAVRHRAECGRTAEAIRRELALVDVDLASIGHPDKWQRDTVSMVAMIERQRKLCEAHLKAMAEFAFSLEGRVETPEVFVNEDFTDAIWAARQRAEAEDA